MKFGKSIFSMPRQLTRLVAACLFTTGLVACGGGSGSEVGDSVNDQPPAEEQSKLLVSLTDAEGDFLTYQVDVTNITMTRANGVVVNILPQTTTVDFAQYVEVTELLTILDAPAGRYDGASMTLDFSDASVTVQDQEGNPILADVVNTEGEPLLSTKVEIQFNDDGGFVLAPGVPAQVTLDFDLDASNDVQVEGDSATVMVNPVLIADTILEEPKTFRLKGLLGAVSADDEEFTLALRPFRVRSGNFGTATVHISDETTFEVDGEVISSDQGLAQLALKDAGTAVITEGAWDRDAREYVASAVYAGSSVPWEQADILRGTVVGREGDLLTVRGAIVQLSEGSFIFNDDITVQVSENTIVMQRGEEASIGQISVGSALFATGEFTEETLDANEGIVRIMPSSVAGTVVSASPLAMDLSFINGRRLAIFDFAGTGTSMETDADPDNYEVFTSTIDLSGIEAGDPVRSRGYVMDFGAAPEDFNATTVISASEVRGTMVVNYGLDGSAMAVTTVDESGLLLNVEDAEYRHHIVVAGIPIDLMDAEQMPLVVPGGERGVYSIWVNGRLEVYTFYSGFARALANHLDDGAAVVRFDAQGFYDNGMATFSSKRIGIILNN